MLHERRLLVAHASNNAGFTIKGWGKTHAGEVCLNFQLNLAVGNFDGVLVYPDHFPDVPAYIHPQVIGSDWSSHQYQGSGVLCLQYGPDNWNPCVTGVDLIKSANQLLWGELLRILEPSIGPVPSRHITTSGQELRGVSRRFLVTTGLRSALVIAESAVVELMTVVTYTAGHSVAVPTALGNPGVPVVDIPQAVTDEGYVRSGWAVAIPTVQALCPVEDAASLKVALGAAWPWAQDMADLFHVLLVHDAGGGMRVFMLAGGDTPLVHEYQVVDVSCDAEQRLPAEFSKLSGITVAIVGLGSLGSKIAVSLARAGVRRFILVDDDVLTPDNLVRNELNWLDVGFLKVHAVDRELKRLAPGIEVRTRPVRYAGQENPIVAADLSVDLSNSNLIVDATASPQAFVALAALARRVKIPMVWGEVFGGGAGAMMARSRPGLDADPLNVRSHILGVMGTLAPVPVAKAKNYSQEVDGQVYVASDADVTALAASMTQFSLDILCAGEESAYPVAAYLIGFRKYWEFKVPFDTIPIDCSDALQPEASPEELTSDEKTDLAVLSNALEAGSSATDNGAN